MRWLFAAPLGLLGLALLVLGGTAAAMLGPDDTAYTRTTVLDAEQPVVTTPELLGYDGVDLHIRASAGEEVFIGTGHPVDVDDYVAEAEHAVLTDVLPWGAETRDEPGEALPKPPAKVDFWTSTVQETGEATYDTVLDGTPQRVLIAPVGKGAAPVEVAVGVTVPHAFTVSLGVAGGGLVLLLLAVVILWWSRRRRRKRSGRRRAVPEAPPAAAPEPPAAATYVRRARRTAPVAALALLASGCSALPTPVEYDDPAKVLFADDEAETELLESLNARFEKALHRADAPRYRTAGLKKYATGPELDRLTYQTRYSELDKDEEAWPPAPRLYRWAVYPSPRRSYPMWGVVAMERNYAPGRVMVMVVHRTAAAAPWKVHATAVAEKEDMPDPAAEPAVIDESTRQRVSKLTRRLPRVLETGKAPKGVRLGGGVLELHRNSKRLRTSDRVRLRDLRVEAQPYDRKQPFHAVPVDGGSLVLASYRLRRTHVGVRPIVWRKPFDQIYTTLSAYELREMLIANVALFVPDKGGKARVIGSYWSPVISPDAGQGSGSSDA